jgi:hypothetical protein
MVFIKVPFGAPWFTLVILANWEVDIRRMDLRPARYKARLCLINNQHTHKKRAGGVAQVVECLPSKPIALTSNPSTAGGGKKLGLF